MTTLTLELTAAPVIAAETAGTNEAICEASTRAQAEQLVRGNEASLLARLEPVVLARNVTLDLSAVDRIDAAGISALIALYRAACESGHSFCLTNVSPRVAQILSVVGLDRILLSHNAVRDSQYGSRQERPAA